MPRISLAQAEAAKKTALERFEARKDVTGVGITRFRGEYAVRLNLSKRAKSMADLPEDIDGVPLKVTVTGQIRSR